MNEHNWCLDHGLHVQIRHGNIRHLNDTICDSASFIRGYRRSRQQIIDELWDRRASGLVRASSGRAAGTGGQQE